MEPALIGGCLWVVAGAGVAMLPLRSQLGPGLGLLLAAPVLVVWIGATVSWAAGAVAMGAGLSMFRRPLRALWRRLRGADGVEGARRAGPREGAA